MGIQNIIILPTNQVYLFTHATILAPQVYLFYLPFDLASSPTFVNSPDRINLYVQDYSLKHGV